MSLGPHADFIVAAYAVTLFVVALLFIAGCVLGLWALSGCLGGAA